MSFRSILPMMLVAASLVAQAPAERDTFNWLQIQAAGSSQSNADCVQDGALMGLGLGRWEDKVWGWEIALQTGTLSSTASLWKARETHFNPSLLFSPFGTFGPWRPFVRGSVGLSQVETPLSLTPGTGIRPNFLFGAGVQGLFGDHFLASTEVRQNTVLTKVKRNELEVLVGLGIRWGNRAAEPTPRPLAVSPATAPAPVLAPKPEPVVKATLKAEPAPALALAPTPAPKVEPTPAPVVAPAPAPKPEPVVKATPKVEPTPAPVVAPAPAPKPEPVVKATPKVEPTPTPVVAPAPAPKPVPVVKATPKVEPTPAPVVAPAPAPKPEPVVKVTPKAEPAPAPVVTAAPAPKPEPVVKATPKVEPTPAPAPKPTPVVTPQGTLREAVIHFAVNSSKPGPTARALIHRLAESLRGVPSDAPIQVEGFTCTLGPRAYNQALSRRRAERVAQLLRAEGVAAARLQVSASGPDKPSQDNHTRKGRAANRRAEVRLSGLPAGAPVQREESPLVLTRAPKAKKP